MKKNIFHPDNITPSYSAAVPADTQLENTPRNTPNAGYAWVAPHTFENPKVVANTEGLDDFFGIKNTDTDYLSIFSGKIKWPHFEPYAMCYGGHQFGQWAGQLGDGRAINISEVLWNNQPFVFQLKGVGKTPYSRRGDGFAVVRSSIREFLCSEAMHHLGIPTTRAISLVETGEMVVRDMLYNGNLKEEKGAAVCRIAPSFVRFGNFQLFAAREETHNLKSLADHCIQNFFPEITTEGTQKYVHFFRAVAQRSLEMVLHWQRVGFVHGVMNTDNMSILGLTIDYGPYGFLENYEPTWTPNTTDLPNRRYSYQNQITIVQWNLWQLANGLYPLIHDAAELEKTLQWYSEEQESKYLQMMYQKLGISSPIQLEKAWITQTEQLLEEWDIDFTIFFRNLLLITPQNNTPLLDAIYDLDKKPNAAKAIEKWTTTYWGKINKNEVIEAQRKETIATTNPKYILRNYMAYLAIEQAEKGDYSLVHEMQTLLQNPYAEQPQYQKWFAKRPDWAKEQPGSSTLSCSS